MLQRSLLNRIQDRRKSGLRQNDVLSGLLHLPNRGLSQHVPPPIVGVLYESIRRRYRLPLPHQLVRLHLRLSRIPHGPLPRSLQHPHADPHDVLLGPTRLHPQLGSLLHQISRPFAPLPGSPQTRRQRSDDLLQHLPVLLLRIHPLAGTSLPTQVVIIIDLAYLWGISWA